MMPPAALPGAQRRIALDQSVNLRILDREAAEGAARRFICFWPVPPGV